LRRRLLEAGLSLSLGHFALKGFLSPLVQALALGLRSLDTRPFTLGDHATEELR
jgi:hypothetical protein